MSRSYDYENTVNEAIASLVSNDFDGTGFDVQGIEGTLTVTANVTLDLPDGWEFSGYNDTIEIERSVSF